MLVNSNYALFDSDYASEFSYFTSPSLHQTARGGCPMGPNPIHNRYFTSPFLSWLNCKIGSEVLELAPFYCFFPLSVHATSVRILVFDKSCKPYKICP